MAPASIIVMLEMPLAVSCREICFNLFFLDLIPMFLQINIVTGMVTKIAIGLDWKMVDFI